MRSDRRYGKLAQLLVLLGLTGFAISQPVLSVLGSNPLVFRSNGFDNWALLAFAAAVVVSAAIELFG